MSAIPITWIEHNRRKGKFTDAGILWILVHTKSLPTRLLAMQREKFIRSRKLKSCIQSIYLGTIQAGRAFRFAEGSWEEPCSAQRNPARSQKHREAGLFPFFFAACLLYISFLVRLCNVIISGIPITWKEGFLNITGEKENSLMQEYPGCLSILNHFPQSC